MFLIINVDNDNREQFTYICDDMEGLEKWMHDYGFDVLGMYDDMQAVAQKAMKSGETESLGHWDPYFIRYFSPDEDMNGEYISIP